MKYIISILAVLLLSTIIWRPKNRCPDCPSELTEGILRPKRSDKDIAEGGVLQPQRCGGKFIGTRPEKRTSIS